jgi:hypothetical protein
VKASIPSHWADADLVLVVAEGRAVALARPYPAPEGLPRYAVSVARPPDGLRLYALTGRSAVEIGLKVKGQGG